MLRHALFAAVVLASGAAQADTFSYAGGTGERSVTLAYSGAIGQSFTAATSDLTSFGFQFEALNPSNANEAINFTLRQGTGLTGSVVTSQTFTLPTSINDRIATWFDLALSGVSLTAGATYTAVLGTVGGSFRNAVVYGPDLNIFTGVPKTGDAYTGGALQVADVSTVGPQCNSGTCDLNFRMTGTVAAPVPEPGEWAMMMAGLGTVGFVARRRRRVR